MNIGNRVKVISGAHKGMKGKAVATDGDRIAVDFDSGDTGIFNVSELEVIHIRWRTILFVMYLVAFVAWAFVIAKGLATR
jgi:hypothetical protein